MPKEVVSFRVNKSKSLEIKKTYFAHLISMPGACVFQANTVSSPKRCTDPKPFM